MSTDLEPVDELLRNALVELVGRGTPLIAACKILGINKRAVNKAMLTDADFAEEMTDAIALKVARVDQVVYDHALDGDFKFVEMFMREHRPELVANHGGKAAQANGQKIQAIVVNITRELVMGEQGQPWLDQLQGSQIIEVEARESDDSDS